MSATNLLGKTEYTAQHQWNGQRTPPPSGPVAFCKKKQSEQTEAGTRMPGGEAVAGDPCTHGSWLNELLTAVTDHAPGTQIHAYRLPPRDQQRAHSHRSQQVPDWSAEASQPAPWKCARPGSQKQRSQNHDQFAAALMKSAFEHRMVPKRPGATFEVEQKISQCVVESTESDHHQ